MKINSIKFNFIMNLILTVSNFLFPLITFPYVSRVLLPEGTGKVAFAVSVITYFSMLATFGVNSYGVRATAQVRDDKLQLSKVTHEILAINFAVMCFVYMLFFITLDVVPQLSSDPKLFIITSSMILFSIIGVEWLYKGLEQYRYITVRTIIFRLIALAATFLLVKEKSDYLVFAAITAFATVGSGFVNFINLRKFILLKFIGQYEFKRHLKPMFIFFLTSFAIAIYTTTDSAMLGFMTNDTEVGFYNAAIRIKAILLSIVTSLGVVLLPRLSYYIQNNMQFEFNAALNKSINFVFVIALPVVLFFILFAEQTILVLAGEQYTDAILPLKIVMLAIVFVGITNILGVQILIPLKKETALFTSVIIAAFVDIVLNLWLIPKFASVGAAIAVVCAEFAVLCVQIYMVRSYLSILFVGIEYGKIIISLALSGIVSYFLYPFISSYLIVNLAIIAIIFGIVYLLSLFVLKEKFINESFLMIKDKFL